MKFSIATVPAIVLVALIAIAQTFLLSGHTLVGDGIAYTSMFESLENASLFEGYGLFQEGVGASEFFSYLIFYSAAQTVSYDLFIYLTNVLFAFSIYFLYQKFEKGIFWYLLTVPLNYYFLVLCFGAQRLKLGIFFLILAVLASEKFRSRLFAGLAFFCHFQLVIIFVGERIREFFSGKTRLPLAEIILGAALCVSVVMLVPMLQMKVLTYVLERGAVNLYTFLFSFLIAAYLSKWDIGVLAEFLFFLVLILIIGESRVNILVFFLVWRMAFLDRKYPALVAYPIALYLAVKGVIFMMDVANGGTGFGVP